VRGRFSVSFHSAIDLFILVHGGVRAAPHDRM
jgi:hypothetical protein